METTTLLAALMVIPFVITATPSMAGSGCQSLKCKENVAKLLKAPPNKASCPGCDLYHANLRKMKLNHANLQGADLRGADLRGTEFFKANLRGAKLINANVKDTHFQYTDLRDADFRYTNFSKARLLGVNLFGATLPPNIKGTRFSGRTTLPDGKKIGARGSSVKY